MQTLVVWECEYNTQFVESIFSSENTRLLSLFSSLYLNFSSCLLPHVCHTHINTHLHTLPRFTVHIASRHSDVGLLCQSWFVHKEHHVRLKVDDWFCYRIIWSEAACLGHSGEETGRAINWSPSGGELGQMAGEASEQTWQTQMCSGGELGMFGGPCPGGLQLKPPAELLWHPYLEFACSPRVCMGFFRVLQFPHHQKHVYRSVSSQCP